MQFFTLRLLSLILLLSLFNPGLLISQAFHVKPYLQDITTESAKVMFETTSGTTAEIFYGPSPFALNSVVPTSSQTGEGATRIFTGQITGLNPKVKYYYKVVLGNGVQTLVYHFTTLDIPENEQNINFISVSDMQRTGAHPQVYYDIINQGIIPIANDRWQGGLEDLHGLIIPGDLVQSGGTYSMWKNDFFDLGENVSTKVPLYPSLGNHEYYNNGEGNYLKYFDLPINGHPGYPEQWWFKDFSNIRVIALNSNSNTTGQSLQLTFLDTVLQNTCSNEVIDFVFVQLHAPYKSEMWTPGESSFTGQVVTLMENFTQNCQKPSIHLFGHTHGYSRGQSKYHEHLWINVASAGGAIDYWGQFPNYDYEQFTHSEDEYGFVLLESKAGLDPEVNVIRYTRGDDYITRNNEVTDSIILKKSEYPPIAPSIIWPADSVDFSCVQLKASEFIDPHNFHQGSQWQISTSANFSTLTYDRWKQHENLYQNTDTQINDDLTDEVGFSLAPGQTYYWRVRYRDNFLRWSPWSETGIFYTRNSNTTANLLQNAGGEDGITFWSGDIESLTNDQCGSVPVYQGSRFFAVGGVCANEQTTGNAEQIINVASYASQIDNGEFMVWYGGYMRAWAANNDNPQIAVAFMDGSGNILQTTPYQSQVQPAWTLVQNQIAIPPLTRRIKFLLRGIRNAGTDNDSYFDELFLKLTTQTPCSSCIGNSNVDTDGDGFCGDVDCDDNHAGKYPGKVESCDGIDNNCDGISDSGSTVIWTGAGDGELWADPANWDQMMVPLPCQHVIINTNDTVYIHNYIAVKSLTIGTAAGCIIQEDAFIILDPAQETEKSGLLIEGFLENYGRINIQNADENGLELSGNLLNFGRIYILNILQQHILFSQGSVLNNHGLIHNK